MKKHIASLANWAYFNLPIGRDTKQKAKDLLFTHAPQFFKHMPVYHVWHGRKFRNDAMGLYEKFGRMPEPDLPSNALLYSLKCAGPKKQSGVVKCDVIVPVYDGHAETLNCLVKVLQSKNETPYELIVINDASPNEWLVKDLEQLAAAGLFTLLHNKRNLGFVQTVNRGMALHPERDVLLLNSDTEVYNNWLDRMVAHVADDVASITPMSNNAEICNYPTFCKNNDLKLEMPYAELDLLMADVNHLRHVDVPTGVGFCMWIARKALIDVGLFDAKSFGKGYGEENDFCLRSSKAGYRHLLAGDVFVRHIGGVSFGDSKNQKVQRAIKKIESLHPGYHQTIHHFVQQDSPMVLRRSVDIARLKKAQVYDRAFLFVMHDWGGGTERHAQDMAMWLNEENVSVYFLRPGPIKGQCHVEAQHDIYTPNMQCEISDTHALSEMLATLKIEHIHIHHLIDYDDAIYAAIPKVAEALNIGFDMTLHDYYSVCPQINLIDASRTYCGEPDEATCNACIAGGSKAGDKREIAQWRALQHDMLRQARAIYVPNQDGKDRFARYFPDLEITVRNHPESPIVCALPRKPRAENTPVKVALIGALYDLKGAHVIRECVKDAYERKLPIEFHIIGYFGLMDDTFHTYPNVRITGRYAEEDVHSYLHDAACDLALFASVWPETFAYTLSIAYHAGLYPVTFDIGAIANRIRSCGWGEIIPFEMMDDPAGINDVLLQVKIPSMPKQLAVYDKDETYPSLLESYYEFVAAQQKEKLKAVAS